MGENKESRESHRGICGKRGTFDAETELIDEHGHEHHVDRRSDEHRDHGFDGIAGGTHEVVECKGVGGQRNTGEHVEHVFACVREGDFACSERAEDGVEKESEDAEVETDEDREKHERVAEDTLRIGETVLSEENRDTCRAARTDEHAEGGFEVHDRESHGETGNGVRADHLPDENAPDDVVERHDEHTGDGGEAVAEKKPSDGGGGKFCETGIG